MVSDLCFIYLFLNFWFLDLLGTVEEILPNLPEGITVWGMNDSVPQGVTSLKEKLSTASDKPVPRSYHVASSLKAPHLYIFTSGTTGMIHFFLRVKKNAKYLQSNSSHHGTHQTSEKACMQEVLRFSDLRTLKLGWICSNHNLASYHVHLAIVSFRKIFFRCHRRPWNVWRPWSSPIAQSVKFGQQLWQDTC